MSEALFVESFDILNDENSPEEDSVGRIEALVIKTFPDLPPSSTERLVLDILMAHHHNKDPREAARAQKLTTSFATPVARFPDTVHNAPSEIPRDLRPFDQLRELFGQDNSDEDIERVLAHNDFHLQRALDMLSGAGVDLELSKEQMAARIMCRYFLTGNCIRGSQCMYSHDGSSRICRFWMHEKCLAGDSCVFMHKVPIPTEEVVELPGPAALPDLKSLPTLGQKPKPAKKTAKPVKLETRTVPVKPKLMSIKEVLGSGKSVVPLVAPRLVPWKATEFGINQKYVDLRLQAAANADTRNKLLQDSTSAWSLNDAARAKQLSAKGRDAENLMIEQYRTAAEMLWEQQKAVASEIWLDLHGLDLTEAINMLETKIEEVAATQRHSPRVIYIITGRGHFKAKKYADQLTQYVLALLDSKGYKHRDFGVDTLFGRITAVDPWSALAS